MNMSALPAYQSNNDPPQIEEIHKQDKAMYAETINLDTPQPGIEGINPITLLATMFIGGLMWIGIFYLGHLLLQAIF